MLVLRGARLPHAVDGHHEDEFDVSRGRGADLLDHVVLLAQARSPHPWTSSARSAETIELSERWASRCDYTGPYRAAVIRSLLVLRLLTHGGTGGIVAAPTTSLPEDFGGERNWDYRYCWLRDASLTLEALLASGYDEETRLWRDWLLRAVAGDPEDLQIMYAVDGARELPERELDHLPGLRRLAAGPGRQRRRRTSGRPTCSAR